MGPKKKKSPGSKLKPVSLKKALPPTHIQKVGTQLEHSVEAENEGKVRETDNVKPMYFA